MINNQLQFEYVCPDCSTSLYITAASESVSCGCGFTKSFMPGQEAPESPIQNFGGTVEVSRDEIVRPPREVKPLKTETTSVLKSDVVEAKKLEHVRVAQPVEMSIMGGAASPSTVIDRKELLSATSSANAAIEPPEVLVKVQTSSVDLADTDQGLDETADASVTSNKERLKELEKELVKEKKEVETLTQRLSANEVLNETIQEHAKKNEESLNYLETQTGTIKVDLDVALESLKKVKGDLNETQKVNEDLVKELSTLKEELSTLKVEEELQATQRVNEELVKELANLKAEVSAMKQAPVTDQSSEENAEKPEEGADDTVESSELTVEPASEDPVEESTEIGEELKDETEAAPAKKKTKSGSQNKLKLKGAAKPKANNGLKRKSNNQAEAKKLQETAVMMDDFDELKETKGKGKKASNLKSKRKSSKTRSFSEGTKAKGKVARTRLSKEDQDRLRAEAAEQAKKIKWIVYGLCFVLLIAMVVIGIFFLGNK